MRPLRIAVWHNLPSGGGKRALHYHVRGLVQRGHHVEVWCPTSADRDYLPLETLVQVHTVPLAWKRETCDRLKGSAKYLYLQSKFRAIEKHCQQCIGDTKIKRFDLLFVNTCQLIGTPPLAKYADIPCLLYLQEPHRCLYEAMPHNMWAAPPKASFSIKGQLVMLSRINDLARCWHSRVHVREEINNAKGYHRILVNSLFSRESIMRAYGLNSHVCELGIDVSLFKPLLSKKNNTVINIGSLSPNKNHLFVIDAIRRVKAVKLKLLCICNSIDSKYKLEVESYAQSCGVDIEIKTAVSDDDLVKEINQAKLMVYAPRLEPFGYAPLEANACGLPVVAIAEGGIRETVIDGINGRVVKPDPDVMAKAIEALLNNEALINRLGKNGVKLVRKRWSLDTAIDNLEKHIGAFVV